MSAGKANCAVCGQPLVYWEEAQEVTCVVCGKKETGHSVCEDGHYVCDTCHRTGGVDFILGLCSKSTSKDPIEIVMTAMDDRSIYPNGPEHHTLVGAALLTAYANAGGDIDLEKALAELKNRSLRVPGGTCGFWGVCGAATSTGQAMSIINGSTPMTREPWAQCQRLTSEVLGNLAELGGPRCCKRTAFTAIETAVPYIADTMGVQMDVHQDVRCHYYKNNAECLHQECPYFPGA